MELLLLLLVPILIALGGFLVSIVRGDRYYVITLREFGVLIGLVVIVVVGGYFISRMASTYDVEVWSGRVAGKEKEWTSCEHSYSCNPHQCNCSTDSKGVTTCSTCYDTCYEHVNDWNWVLTTSNSEQVGIARIDRRGSYEPPRFTKARIGDPTALTHAYTNYIKANPWSLLRKQGLAEKFKPLLPAYPASIYDYHYVNRFMAAGSASIPVGEVAFWNRQLMELNADLGRKKQVNIIMLVVPTSDSAYVHALEEAWLGGKKNDFVVVFGAEHFPRIEWVRTMSWTRAEDLKVALVNDLQEIGTFERRDEIVAKLRTEIERSFVRRPMEDFEYLMAGIRPPTWALILLFVLGTGISIGCTVYFWREDPFHSGRGLV
ncbi:MAG: hypothetical protein A3I44_05215 [Candidatus Sungbacteria bacterium RIFCSPLOWO2_02_FULL_51_17]|uniref:TPM domain-containing protein n=1 Tax=Candidatus Sungbacteria bacterium RIFCSPHIGHO2_02_FULL_51_29 TaxID=1802273 RepID=A0A1G2KP29_9BACT|nr:MAG: hypothetical protein A2676_00650 [Candidatus Sungbacteria bacterium RIFCSPHIGHO2_01_FULL_51_22]OHA01167.1 MAG: hypothetical protein A3C16_04585 [Candidatus Sungbacteria bacterium RIFCSPHIGHO2_02_FULL_51_29]OHA08049.1 MAG: hypothetical protein A3B29_03825 [Candidatus Sungbacteria bacterium RIFCSPLOWO2_01_FULL_51_34]OHA11471.1 MAG: hypothetical protein A3I44_05215 [Candidatus Sungbacteria bacterium RIFCSPLOWO2_02_FULL_51_17]